MTEPSGTQREGLTDQVGVAVGEVGRPSGDVSPLLPLWQCKCQVKDALDQNRQEGLQVLAQRIIHFSRSVTRPDTAVPLHFSRNSAISKEHPLSDRILSDRPTLSFRHPHSDLTAFWPQRPRPYFQPLHGCFRRGSFWCSQAPCMACGFLC